LPSDILIDGRVVDRLQALFGEENKKELIS
jgi:hypothetical protein